MELKTDHSFHIGEQHLRNGKPCQDYTLSGNLSENIAYAIVSDGCSSGGKTDIGARLLSLATERAIHNEKLFIDTARDAYAEVFRSTLGLEHKDMLATNLYAVVENGDLRVHVTGDGVVVLQYEKGLVIHQFEWNKNTLTILPIDLLEVMNISRLLTVTVKKPLTMKMYSSWNTEDEVRVETSSCLSVDNGMNGIDIFDLMQSSMGMIQSVGLFSDGVEQVDAIDTLDVVKKLMSFKSTSGQFVTRRMNRFLSEAKKAGRGPIDDIAMAVIHLGENSYT